MKNRVLFALGLLTASACATAPPEAVPGSALPPPVELPALRPANLPPPVSGGTLIVARDGRTAIAADHRPARRGPTDLTDHPQHAGQGRPSE